MKCPIAPARIGLAAVGAIVALTVNALAQTPDQPNPVDPPDTLYHTGAVPEDPLIQSRRAIIPRQRAYLPLSVDLSKRMPAVGDQGQSSSCVAWATAYAARSYYTSVNEARNISQPINLPSPNYVYHLARTGSCDGGSTFGHVIDVLKKGALSLAEFPFTATCSPPASADLVARAHDFKVQGLTRVDISQPDDVKAQLAQDNPVLIAFHDSTAWQRLRGSSTFIESTPPADDKVQGWHAMTIVGYDEHRQAFRLMNSWGKGWGDHGYAWFGYDLLRSRVKEASTSSLAHKLSCRRAQLQDQDRDLDQAQRPRRSLRSYGRCPARASTSNRKATNLSCQAMSLPMTTSTRSGRSPRPCPM
jgi:C1A family cysteine protease